MSKKVDFTWDETSGICGCSIFLTDLLHGYGIAQCADQDKDVISERTGMAIAEFRAQINILQNYKNNVLRPSLDALKHLMSTMVQSPKFNPTSYEAKRIEKEMNNYRQEIDDINSTINSVKANLYDYINFHEEVTQKIRKNEHKGYTDEESERLVHEIDFFEKVMGNGDKT